MTEKQWFACQDPETMLEFLKGRAGDRKLRLFAAACCRRIWDLFIHQESRDGVEALERFAEGELGPTDFTNAWVAANHVRVIKKTRKRDSSLEKSAAWAVSMALFPEAFQGVSSTAAYVRRLRDIPPGEEVRRQCADLRDLFGNPFRPVAAEPAWRTDAVLLLSRAAVAERRLPVGALDNAHLAVLADALEEAGCADADILGHCRGPGPHARGCWVVDLLLGKQ